MLLLLLMEWSEPVEKIVLYNNADIDALFAAWLFVRHVPYARYARFEFVKISETWKNQPPDSDPSIVHIDTGGGRFDHHKRNTPSVSILMAKELGLEKDPALERLLDFIHSYEKAEKLPFYAPSKVLTGLYYKYQRNPRLVIGKMFELFDVFYGQEKYRVDLEKNADKVVWKDCEGKKVAVLDEIPELRDWAFENGAEVVVWKFTNNKAPYYGIQVNRHSPVSLVEVISSLRKEEARLRGTEITEEEAKAFEEIDKLPGWYLHLSEKLVVCGTKKRTLKRNEISLLVFDRIIEILCANLSKL